MGLFGKIFSKLNPVNLVKGVFDSTIGRVLNIARTIVKGIMEGKSFGEIFKAVLKDVAALAIQAVIGSFTAGTGAALVNAIIGKVTGALSGVVANIASSALPNLAKNFLTSQITRFSQSLTQDFFKNTLTDLVCKALKLPSPEANVTQDMLRNASGDLTDAVTKALTANMEKVFTEDELRANKYTIDPETYRDRSHEQSGFEREPRDYTRLGA